MTLEQVGAVDGYCLHCIDLSLTNKMGEFEDVSKVEKFEISEAEYEKRDDTFRKFRDRQLATNPHFKSYVGEVDKNY